MRSRKRVSIALFLVLVLCLVGVAVSLRPPPDPKATGETGASGLATFYQQKLTWTDCGSDRCTRVTVPIDYDKPAGATLSLLVKVRPADGGNSKGSLFINPGGPGGSGVEYLSSFTGEVSEQMLRDYDIVGFDPRGVGGSTPVECLSDKRLDDYIKLDHDPDDAAEEKALLRSSVEFGNGCRDNAGELASHVSTLEAAKDIDVMRALLGQKELDFYGASYGTQLGATYAELFPKRVGRMVLDGAVDLSLGDEQQSVGQTEGFQRALTAYIADCVKKATCPLGTDPKAAETKLADFIKGVDKRPLKTTGKREVTESLAFNGVILPLYDRAAWPVLTTELTRALKGDGTIMLRVSDLYTGRQADGSYKDNVAEAFLAVRCLDSAESPTLDEVKASIPAYEKISPAFGSTMAWGAADCIDWPLKTKNTQIPVRAEGAPPILVVGTTRDPATPYEWAESLADQLATGVLVTRDGDGHTAFNSGNACIDSIIDNFFLDGVVPKDGVECKAP